MASNYQNVPVAVAANTGTSAPWQFIPTRVHGILDYAMGLLLIVLPFLPGFPHMGGNGIESWLPVVRGAGALVYSLLTNYELGLFRVLPMPLHLGFDLVSGLLLAASPWIFRFSPSVYLPHLILGLAEMGAAIFTKIRPVYAGGRESVPPPEGALDQEDRTEGLPPGDLRVHG